MHRPTSRHACHETSHASALGSLGRTPAGGGRCLAPGPNDADTARRQLRLCARRYSLPRRRSVVRDSVPCRCSAVRYSLSCRRSVVRDNLSYQRRLQLTT